jgi:tripeptidyl-peptidase-1
MFNQSDATWQKAAVAAYVAQGGSLPLFPPSGSFPPLGRATPDVSGLGEGYQVYIAGTVEPVGGTSASSPMFAALVSLINEARFAKGMPQMGFLNPFLYQNPTAFFDVVKGTNAVRTSRAQHPPVAGLLP